ncbi:MAG: hypothetical protein DRR16_20550 [Candidatus Parabeggiatoa sp. nov. 3]|nr:MAG: hypothetical protein DRR00_12825 [Gammaproteobacteria bacterium]RKZ64884.1 MAG: hypothetical protein DRQ99_14350 [Gammaproteobacteria bacterium]RKZ82079.1 MAG: hypothetical protein DRR16_20550 [Gammaproteobacteria bacterium]HEW97109.1 hypothetical protein [Beggiatoa sp.]
MKLCPGMWCPSTLFLATVPFLLSLIFALVFSFFSLNRFFDIPIHDIGNVTSIKADHIDESNEGKLVHLTGNITTDDLATDPLFGVIVSDVIKLRRVVEKFEGQDKGWSDTTLRLNSKIFVPKQVKLGAFTLSSGLIDKFSHFQHLPMTKELFEQIQDNLSVQLGGKLHFKNDNYYVGQNPTLPQFGDLRIRFFVVNIETVSVIAQQVGSDLVSYQTQTDIELLKSGALSLEEIIIGHNISVKTYYFSQFSKRFLPYFLGFFPLALSIYLLLLTLKLLNNFPPAWTLTKSSLKAFIFLFVILLFITYGVIIVFLVILYAIYPIILLLSKLFKNIPFFDSLTNRINWLSALIITLSLSLIIIASIWIIHLPILGIILIIMAVGNLYFLKPAHRLLTPINFELPQPPLVQETVIPQKEFF